MREKYSESRKIFEIQKIVEYLEKSKEIDYITASSLINRSPTYTIYLLKFIAVKTPDLFEYKRGKLVRKNGKR